MTSFEDILAQSLSDIETGRATVEDCLQRHPAEADALRPLLRTAAAVRTAPEVNPSPSFEAAAPARMLNLIAARQPATARASPAAAPGQRLGRWTPLLLRVTAIVVAASVLCAGTAFAARDSLPDSPLYPVKRTVEQARVIATPNQTQRARLFVGLMDLRALEMSAMIKRGKPERARETGVQYARLLRDATLFAERVPANRPEGMAFLTFMRQHLASQQAVLQRQLASDPGRTEALLRALIASNQHAIESIDVRLTSI